VERERGRITVGFRDGVVFLRGTNRASECDQEREGKWRNDPVLAI